MHFSRSLKASPHCLPSPDGKLIATLLSSAIHVREVQSLAVVNRIKLPTDFAGPVSSLQWSPSSCLVLVAGPSQVQIYSAQDSKFTASIKNPAPPGAKPSYISFGASDTEVCVCTSFGLKFAVYDLSSSKGVEISNPKFFAASSAPNGFSFRPRTRHLALLTRTAGKDLISVHDPSTRGLLRSWSPDAVDSQGLTWSPDGKWLVVWESPAHGHKVLFYTPDGHAFKTWLGPSNPQPQSKQHALGAGVKRVAFSPDGNHLAIGDSSRRVCVFDMASVVEVFQLPHPASITPKDTLQVWQEQVSVLHTGPSVHTFLKATQAVAPAGRGAKDASDARTGCSLILFDSSSTLVATRLDDSPSTAWIWDLAAAELRAVLLFHVAIVGLSWHPSIRETLLIKCEGEQYSNLVFIWDPLSEGPNLIDFGSQLRNINTTAGRTHASWLNLERSTSASIFFSDAHNYLLAFLGESEQECLPWQGGDGSEWSSPARREESPLELIPAADHNTSPDEELDDDGSELEDTFIHKR